jgi:hypothetical protein
MDPDKALETIRTALVRADEYLSSDEDLARNDYFKALVYAQQVAEGFRSLDQWLSKGGHLPEEWAR